MKINEELSILFWLKHDKGSKDGQVPIYVRITVNGDLVDYLFQFNPNVSQTYIKYVTGHSEAIDQLAPK